jgi:DNA-binding PadR family transcriptional regulator
LVPARLDWQNLILQMRAVGQKRAFSVRDNLTENEGILLSLIVREEPVTPYHLYRSLANSPTKAINSSKGQLYPAIRRLKDRGLIITERVEGDRRNAERVSATETGKAAVRTWVQNIELSHIVLDDPLRTRVLAFDLLTKPEQLAWIAEAKALVKAKAVELDNFNNAVTLPFQDYAFMTAAESLRVKMDALDELLYQVAGVQRTGAVGGRERVLPNNESGSEQRPRTK